MNWAGGGGVQWGIGVKEGKEISKHVTITRRNNNEKYYTSHPVHKDACHMHIYIYDVQAGLPTIC